MLSTKTLRFILELESLAQQQFTTASDNEMGCLLQS